MPYRGRLTTTRRRRRRIRRRRSRRPRTRRSTSYSRCAVGPPLDPVERGIDGNVRFIVETERSMSLMSRQVE